MFFKHLIKKYISFGFYYFVAFGTNCMQGVRPHKRDGDKYKIFESCGISDNADLAGVPCRDRSCYVTDFWIQGIEDKPLTIYSCGDIDGKGIVNKSGDCKAVCNKEEFLKNMKQIQKKELRDILKEYATEEKKFTEKCINMLTKVEKISVAKSDKLVSIYCTKESYEVAEIRDCKPTQPIPITNGPAANQTGAPGKSTQPTAKTNGPAANQTGATRKSTQPTPKTNGPAANQTGAPGNATTSGDTKNLKAIMNLYYLAFVFVTTMIL